jgi:hypothetical protein
MFVTLSKNCLQTSTNTTFGSDERDGGNVAQDLLRKEQVTEGSANRLGRRRSSIREQREMATTGTYQAKFQPSFLMINLLPVWRVLLLSLFHSRRS